jgi:hypothetical protein
MKERNDSNKRRKANSTRLKRRILRSDAYPSVFPNRNPNFSTPRYHRETKFATSEARVQKENEEIEVQINKLKEDDAITTLL